MRGEINGVGLPFILDTGSDGVVLSGPAARRARIYLPPGREGRAVSPGFDARYRAGVFRELRLGPLLFGRGVAAVPLAESRSFGPAASYGVLGCSVLGRFRVTFDFSRGEVRLERHAVGGSVGTLLTGVRIGGRAYWMLVDSGAGHLFLEPWAALQLGLIDAEEAGRHERKSAAFGRSRATSVEIPRVEVAGRTFEDVRAGVVSTFGKAAPGEVRPAGLLGLAGFGELVWTVDFPAKRILVEDP